MNFVVDMTQPVSVEVGAVGLRQVAQEVRTLLSTRKGSVPLDRDFGLSWEMIDQASPVAKQLFISEIAQKIERYVPRCQYKGIEFLSNELVVDGVLTCKITVEIKEEYANEFS